jgi:hypothetical protein
MNLDLFATDIPASSLMEEQPVYTYKLIRVYDLREIDEWTGERIPLMAGDGNICNRCGREHAKVYEVKREQDGKLFTVGSTCCKKLFGWEPEKAETKRLEKEARKLAENAAYQRLLSIAGPIAAEVNALPLPRIIVLEEREEQARSRYAYTQIVWGTEGSKVKVWGLKSDGLTNERRNCFYSSWKSEQVSNRLEALYPPTSQLMREDTNHNRRYKLSQIIRELIGSDFIH